MCWIIIEYKIFVTIEWKLLNYVIELLNKLIIELSKVFINLIQAGIKLGQIQPQMRVQKLFWGLIV